MRRHRSVCVWLCLSAEPTRTLTDGVHATISRSSRTLCSRSTASSRLGNLSSTETNWAGVWNDHREAPGDAEYDGWEIIEHFWTRWSALDMGKRLLENSVQFRVIAAMHIKLNSLVSSSVKQRDSFLGSRIEQYPCLELLHAFSQLSGRWTLPWAQLNQLQTTSCRCEWKLTAEIDSAGPIKTIGNGRFRIIIAFSWKWSLRKKSLCRHRGPKRNQNMW